MKVGIVCYRYSIEISPFIKNICTYFADKDYKVDVLIDKLQRDSEFNLSSVNINILTIPVNGRIFKKIFADQNELPEIEKNIFAERIKEKICSYDLIFAADFSVLDILKTINADFNKIIALMLEGNNYCKAFNKEYVKNILLSCKKIIFTDNDRKKDFYNIYNFELNNIEYLPVSIRTKNITKKTEINSLLINLIYSGYFADWACVHEIINMFNKNKKANVKLTLHGHTMGTEGYFKETQKLGEENENIIFDESYYNDERYFSFLSGFDIGIAIYKDIYDDGNFANIILSSGKIANYLSSGLAVITNLENEITSKPPFLLVRNFSETEFIEKIEYYNDNKQVFMNAAYELSNSLYNFDKYMNNIFDKLIS